MGTPTRFPYGVTTAEKQNPLGMFGYPDPTQWHVFFDDFDTWVTDTSSSAKYTITTVEAGASSATEAAADERNGVLLITNDAADNDSDFFQKLNESYLLTSGKKTIFKARFKCSDDTQVEWYMGLMVTDTDPFSSTAGDGVTDGVFFMKEDGTTNVNFYVQKDATTGQLTSAAVTTASAADTYMTLAFYFDGKRYVQLWKDDAYLATVDLTTTLATYLPNTEMTISFGLKNGEAVAKTMSVDYIFCAAER
jgi:hypothetical protein